MTRKVNPEKPAQNEKATSYFVNLNSHSHDEFRTTYQQN
jgi:hypothetical protein